MQRRTLHGARALALALLLIGTSCVAFRAVRLSAAVRTQEEAGVSPLPGVASGEETAFGTIRGRLVWEGADLPKLKDLQPQGKAERDPEVCGRDERIPDDSLLIDAKTKGIKNAIAYLVHPRGTNPKAEQALRGQSPQVFVDQGIASSSPASPRCTKARSSCSRRAIASSTTSI